MKLEAFPVYEEFNHHVYWGYLVELAVIPGIFWAPVHIGAWRTDPIYNLPV